MVGVVSVKTFHPGAAPGDSTPRTPVGAGGKSEIAFALVASVSGGQSSIEILVDQPSLLRRLISPCDSSLATRLTANGHVNQYRVGNGVPSSRTGGTSITTGNPR